jgi:TolB-like protein/Flp pilus assembly protein TadD
MGRDDSATLAELKAHRRELIDPKIAEYGGRIVKTTGDGLLLEFPSVVDAVRCAVDVQRGMAERNAGKAPDQRIDFRIGINVGDIIIDGDDIFGDGVNVAARLQALAEPGGICVSRVVRDQVLDKLSFTFDELGVQQVKNIARPVEVYRVDLESGASPASSRSRWSLPSFTRKGTGWLVAGVLAVGVAGIAVWMPPRVWKAAPAPSPPILSVAILPLSAPTGDADASRFSEALTRNLMTGLPSKRQYGRVQVVSGSSAASSSSGAIDARELGRRLNVRYVLEGDVLRGGEENTVNLRLVDAATGGQLWSERNSLRDSDVAAESSVVLRNLCARLRNVLIGAEEQRVKARPVSDLSAPELVLRAFALGGEDPSLAGMTGAGKLVDQALRLEPDLVPALILRAALINNEGGVDPNVDRDRIALEQDRYTARAVQLDPTDPAAWIWRATALASLGRWNAALEANATAIKLEPYEARWYSERANLMILTARPTEALALADRALDLDPANASIPLARACEARLLAGQIERAIQACEKASGLSNHWGVHLALAAAYGNHGDTAKAAAAKAEVLRTVPRLTIAQLRAKRESDNPEYLQLEEKYLYEGLRKAGFSER